MDNYILSIDCGTQGLRGLLFSTKGSFVAIEKINYQPYYSKKPGWAEQNVNVYWEALCKVSKKLNAQNPKKFSKIIGVGITTMRNTSVNVDKKGTPLRPAIIWLDQRKSKKVYRFNLLFKFIFKILKVSDVIKKIQCQGKSNWIRENQPKIWEKTYKYLQLSGFLNYKLTGKFNDSIASQIGHIPFDYKKQKWSKKGGLTDFPSKFYPIESEKLPNLIKPGQKLGKITEKAHLETGIPLHAPVIACGSDKGCETLGMGVLNNEMASISFGTTASIQTTVKKHIYPQRFMPSFPALKPTYFNPEIEIFRGYWMITWFKKEFAHKEVKKAKKKGILPEEALNNLLKKSPPGSMGLVVQPYWSPGTHEPEAKGAMIGFGDVHKKAHIYRAVIEGLAYALLDGMHRLERNGNIKFKKIAVSGGASQSDEICQITSDIFNMPLVRGKTSETSGLGAAIVTLVGIGAFNSLGEAVEKMVNYKKTFYPNPKNVEMYKNLYKKVYKKIYPSLKPLYKNIRETTGYPEN